MRWSAAINEQIAQPFDPFPYILLNLLLSCIAALQAPVIMMSQNRQAAKDRSGDYEVNLRAEMQIMALHEKVDGAQQQDRELAQRLLEEHGRLLSQIESRLARQEAGGRRPGWPPCEAE